MKKPFLQLILKSDLEKLAEHFQEAKLELENATYKKDLILALWFAIHQEELNMARFLYKQDPIVAQIMATIRDRGKNALENKSKLEKGGQRKKRRDSDDSI